MILLVPIVIAILVNYLFLTKAYNPMEIYNDQLQPMWGGQKLLNMFFGLIFASLFVIIGNSILWAPRSVWGIFLRLPIVHKIWTKHQDKMRKIHQKKYEDDFITLTEPEMPYQKLWEREKALHQNIKKMSEDEPPKEIYKLKGT